CYRPWVSDEPIDSSCGFIPRGAWKSARRSQSGSPAVSPSQLYRLTRRYIDRRCFYKGLVAVYLHDAARRSHGCQCSRDGSSVSWNLYQWFQTSAERGYAFVVAAAHFRAKAATKRSVHRQGRGRVLGKSDAPQNRVDGDSTRGLMSPAYDVSA